MKLLILLFILVTSCGDDSDVVIPMGDDYKLRIIDNDTGIHVEKPFIKYVQKFVMFLNAYAREVKLTSLTVKYGNCIFEGVYGQATMSKYHTPTIIIDDSWRTQKEWLKEAIIFHELAHAILLRDHVFDTKIYQYIENDVLIYKKGFRSLMGNYISITEPIYIKYYDELIEELFYYRRK